MTAALSRRRLAALLAFAIVALSLAGPTFAADAPLRTRLPDEKPYQQALRAHLATLTEKDFTHGVTEPVKAVTPANADDAYRLWLLTLDLPRVGVIMHGARLAPGATLPPSQFILANIEDPVRGIIQPAIWPEPLTWLANWNYPGNPYFGSRALKLRAFVAASVDMLMFDDLHLHSAAPMHNRADWFAPHLLMYAYVFNATHEVLASEAAAAYRECLKGMMKRVAAWGPRHDENYLDTISVLAMRLAATAVGDADSMKLAETYARSYFNDPDCFNPAGYFPEQGCLDAGFNGLSLYYATWLALAALDWDFAQEAAKKAWHIRACLIFPEPDGKLTGPSHFNSRTGSDAAIDQWDFAFRVVAASYLTPEAMAQARFPDEEQLKAAPSKVAGAVESQVHNYPGDKNLQRETSGPWRWMLYPNSPQFPMTNVAFDFYPKGFYARRAKLAAENAPALKFPFARDGDFTETFGSALLAAKRPTYGVIIHTGPVSEFKGEGHVEFTGPYGLSGGSLSGFWTRETGPVILGRRAGMQFPNNPTPNFDLPEKWRSWPVNAVAGSTSAGKLFTSARIQQPKAAFEGEKVTVSGTIPPGAIGSDKALTGKIDFTRRFTVRSSHLEVETTLTGDGADSIAELYEVIPVYHRNAMGQPETVRTTIEFKAGGKWSPATEQFTEGVEAIRLSRFTGSVLITFDKPRRVKLAPEWVDGFMSRATCRNVLIDLLESGDTPAAVKESRTVHYKIEAEKK